MTIFSRLLATLRANDRPVLPLRALIGACVLLVALLALTAAPAGAVVTTIEGDTVGLQPDNETFLNDGVFKARVVSEEVKPGEFKAVLHEEPEPIAETFANPAGNPVVHGSSVYAIYWDPTDHYHGDWQGLINGFLHNVSVDSGSLGNVFAIASQYRDKTNTGAAYSVSFRGAYTDTQPYPTSGNCKDPNPVHEYPAHQTKPITCLTDAQLQTQLQSFITEQSLPRGMNSIFYILTPPGVAVCLDEGGPSGHCSSFVNNPEQGFCSYHSDINPGGLPTGDANSVLYGVIPWTAGLVADGDFRLSDQSQGTACQAGEFNPVSEPIEQPPEEGAVDQEPNQVKCPSPDGYCDTGLADLIINQVGIEQYNILTDPLLNGWKDVSGKEATDECRNFFAPAEGAYAAKPGSGAGALFNQTINTREYFLQTAFNLAAMKLPYPGIDCVPGARFEPKFTAPARVNSGDIVGFDGMESDLTLNEAESYPGGVGPTPTYDTYSWSFGDGSAPVTGFAPGAPACTTPWLSPCAASVFHSYTYGGEYTVQLTVTDIAGNVASTQQTVTVVGPPPPAPPAPGGSGGSSTGSSTSGGSSTGSSTTGGTAATIFPNPQATAAIISHSLKTAARKGLAVRYSVNEQVAGRFEVLLPAATAKRLGISGTPAVGLPAGSPAQVVIAKSILVTTKGGRSTVSIPFTKRTSGRLGHSRKLTLTLRMVVRNATAHTPASTTVVTAATLSH